MKTNIDLVKLYFLIAKNHPDMIEGDIEAILEEPGGEDKIKKMANAILDALCEYHGLKKKPVSIGFNPPKIAERDKETFAGLPIHGCQIFYQALFNGIKMVNMDDGEEVFNISQFGNSLGFQSHRFRYLRQAETRNDKTYEADLAREGTGIMWVLDRNNLKRVMMVFDGEMYDIRNENAVRHIGKA